MEHEVHIFTKGIYSELMKQIGGAALMVCFDENGKVIGFDSYSVKPPLGPDYMHGRQVAGEAKVLALVIPVCDLLTPTGEVSNVIVHHRNPGLKCYADGSWNMQKLSPYIQGDIKFLQFWRDSQEYSIDFKKRDGKFKALEDFLHRHAEKAMYDGEIFSIQEEADQAISLLEEWWREYR